MDGLWEGTVHFLPRVTIYVLPNSVLLGGPWLTCADNLTCDRGDSGTCSVEVPEAREPPMGQTQGGSCLPQCLNAHVPCIVRQDAKRRGRRSTATDACRCVCRLSVAQPSCSAVLAAPSLFALGAVLGRRPQPRLSWGAVPALASLPPCVVLL